MPPGRVSDGCGAPHPIVLIVAQGIEPTRDMDRLNAIRLLQALVAAGANSGSPMTNNWIRKVALEIGLKGSEFHSAFAYAGTQDLLNNDEKEGWTSLTGAGEALARTYDPNNQLSN